MNVQQYDPTLVNRDFPGLTRISQVADGVAYFLFVMNNYEMNKQDGENSDDEEEKDVGKREARRRQRIIKQKKIEEALLNAGFYVEKGFSVDGDEIFLAFGLSDRALEEFADSCKFEMELKQGGEAPFELDRRELYEIQDTDYNELFSPAQKQALILQKLVTSKRRGGCGLKLKHDKKQKVYIRLVPLHDPVRKKILEESWASFGSWYRSQPIDAIRLYFGEKIAFYFMWLGTYTQWLWFSGIIGLIIGIVSLSLPPTQVVKDDGTTVNVIRWDNALTPVLALIMMLWATIFNEMWKRYSNQKAYDWGMMNFKETENVREEFKYKDREVDFQSLLFQIPIRVERGPGGKLREKYYPSLKRFLWDCVSYPTIGVLIGSVIVVAFFIKRWKDDIYERNLGRIPIELTVATAIVNTAAMIVFGVIYDLIAKGLNSLENHRTDSDYENALIGKTFIFQFINSNIALFFISFDAYPALQNATLSPEARLKNVGQQRLQDLFIQMFLNLGVKQLISNILELGVPYISTKLKQRTDLKNAQAQGKDVTELGTLDIQNKLADYESPFSDYAEMAVQFGYITQFTLAFPFAPLFALINNIFEIRIDSVKLVKQSKRPSPDGAANIGTWQYVMETIVLISIVVNALLMSITSTVLNDDYGINLVPEENRVSTFIVLEHSFIAIMVIIKYLIPDVPGVVRKAMAWEDYQKQRNFLASKGLLQEDDWDDDDDDDDEVFARRGTVVGMQAGLSNMNHPVPAGGPSPGAPQNLPSSVLGVNRGSAQNPLGY